MLVRKALQAKMFLGEGQTPVALDGGESPMSLGYRQTSIIYGLGITLGQREIERYAEERHKEFRRPMHL